MNIQEQEERDFVVATDADWDRAEASEIGAQNPAQAWILTDRDVWHANPYYVGEIVPHPEDDYAWDEIAAEEAARDQERAAEEVIVSRIPEWEEVQEVISKRHPGDTHPLQCDWGDDIPF